MITNREDFILLTESLNDAYSVTAFEYNHIFNFESIGVKGIIQKSIIFEPVGRETYNLALVTVLDDGELDDEDESNNGDIKNILSTVLLCIEMFLNVYPNAFVSFIGNTAQKVRLYSSLVNRYHKMLSTKFQINGYLNKKPKYFQTGEQYDEIVFSNKNKPYKNKIYEMSIYDKVSYGGNKHPLHDKIYKFLEKDREVKIDFYKNCIEKYLVNGNLVIPDEDYISDEETALYLKNSDPNKHIHT